MTRLRSDDGTALVAAILVTALMLALGLQAIAYVDLQQRASGNQRSSDSAFNLAEGVLETQVYLLSRNWPANQTTASPATCTSAAAVARCPNPAQITANFTSPDWAFGASWKTTIRDNGGAATSFYNEAVVAGQPSWDANGDGRVWTHAQATARRRSRALVALVEVQRDDLSVVFPRNVITAGWVRTTDSGNKVIINTRGSAAQPTPVAVRCTTRTPACLDYQATKGQIAPDTTQTGYTGGNALSAERLDSLRARAIAAGTYYATGCPPNPAGTIVFIENANCAYANEVAPCCNSITSPGILVIATGTFTIGGNIAHHGVVYLPNLQNSSQPVMSIDGNAAVIGAIAVDGPGGVLAGGTSATNVTYSPTVWNGFYGYGTAGIIQNTWREIRVSGSGV